MAEQLEQQPIESTESRAELEDSTNLVTFRLGSGEYAIDIKNVLDIYHIKKADLDGGIISSVVPQITTVAKLAVEKILKKESFYVLILKKIL